MANRNTPGVGNEYEVYVPALFALTLNKQTEVEDFQITSNDDNFAPFDDLVIDITTETKKFYFAIQLKHKEKKNYSLSPDIFAVQSSKNGDFHLRKYCKGFKTFKDKKYHAILYTNGNFDHEKIGKVTSFTMSENCNCPGKEFFHTNEVFESIYKFQVNEKTEATQDVSVKDFSDFFQQFSLYTNQNNVGDFEISIYDILKSTDVGLKYIDFFRKWHQGAFTNKTINRKTIHYHLIDFFLSPVIITERYLSTQADPEVKLFELAMRRFDITVIKSSKEEVACLKSILGNSDTLREDKMIRFAKDFKIIGRFDNNLQFENKRKVLFYACQEPIFVSCVNVSETFAYQVIEMCHLKENNLKLVLICQGEDVDISKLGNLTILQNLSDLFETDKPLYQDIIRKCRLSIQGKKKISLESLLESTDKAEGIEIESKEIVRMLKDNCSIGENQEELPKTYIPREVSVPVYPINQFLDYCLTTGDILVLDNNNFHLIQDILTQKRIQTVDMEDYLEHGSVSKNIILTSTSEFRKSLFDQISIENQNRNVHFVKVFDKHFVVLLLTTKPNIDQIKPIKRTIKEECVHVLLNGPINLLCSNPGMGKSVLLKYLKNTCGSDLWTVAIDFKNYNKFFKKKPKLEEVLFKFLEENKQESFTDKVKRVLVKKKKVAFFFDGLDELEFECVDHVLELVDKLSSERYRIWISSRPNLEKRIQNRLNVLSTDIEDFNESQQKVYITRRLQDEYTKEQIEVIISRICSSTNVANNRKLLGVPLKMFILTQILLDDTHRDKVLKHDFFVLTKLYRYFFEGKYNFLAFKRGYRNEQFDLDTLEGRLRRYEVAGLQTCFGEDMLRQMQVDLQSTHIFLEDVKRRGDPLGIISKIVDDEIVFEHHTYAEYFACVFLSKNFDKVRLIQHRFFSEEYKNLKKIFSILLAEECPLHLAVINQDLEEIKKHIDDKNITDKSLRNPLQLAITNCKHFEYRNFCETNYFYHINDDKDYLDSFGDEEPKNKEILKLMSKFDCFHKDDLFRWNSLDYCVVSKSLLPIEIFLRQNNHSREITSFLHNNFEEDEIAYYASRFSCPNLLSNLLSKRSLLVHTCSFLPDIFDLKVVNTGDTLLHLAVKPSRYHITENNEETDDEIQVVKILLDAGVKVKATNRFGMTALDWVFHRHRPKTLDLLIKKGTTFNSDRYVKQTTLFRAAEDENFALIDFLVYNGDDVNARDSNGRTALDIAIKNRKVKVIGHLLEKGAKLSISVEVNLLLRKAIEKKCMKLLTPLLDKNRNLLAVDENQDILFLAARYYDSKIMRCLIEKGAEVNTRNEDGDTVLHIAARNCHFEMIDLLAKMGTNINAINAEGNTPLHEAFKLNLDKWPYENTFLILLQIILLIQFVLNVVSDFNTVPELLVVSFVNLVTGLPILKAVLGESLRQQINKTIEMLLVNKANLYARNNLDQSPLNLAIENGHLVAIIEGKNMRKNKMADKTILPDWTELAIFLMILLYIAFLTYFYEKGSWIFTMPNVLASIIGTAIFFLYTHVPISVFSIPIHHRYIGGAIWLLLLYCHNIYFVQS